MLVCHSSPSELFSASPLIKHPRPLLLFLFVCPLVQTGGGGSGAAGGPAALAPISGAGATVDTGAAVGVAVTREGSDDKRRVKVGLDMFDMVKVIGKGSFGTVLLVSKKDTGV